MTTKAAMPARHARAISMTHQSIWPRGAWLRERIITSLAAASAAITSAPTLAFLRTSSITARLSMPPERLYNIALMEPNRNPDRNTFVSISRMLVRQSIRYTA